MRAQSYTMGGVMKSKMPRPAAANGTASTAPMSSPMSVCFRSAAESCWVMTLTWEELPGAGCAKCAAAPTTRPSRSP